MATQAFGAALPGHKQGGELAAFLVLTAIAEGLLTAALAAQAGAPPPAPVMLGIMWAPGLVALAVQLAARRTLRGFGWMPGRWGYLALGYAVPLVYGALCLLAAQALGGGEVNLTRWAVGAGRYGMAPTALNGMLIQMTILLPPGLLMGLGEEIGWRGFMVPRLGQRFGFWGVVNLSYLIWFAFHVPGMLVGDYHGTGTPLAYSFACFAALLYPATVLMTWLRLRSDSLWPCVMYHGAHNLFIQVMWNSAFRPNARAAWLLGEFGVLTALTCGALVALLLWRGGVPETEADRR